MNCGRRRRKAAAATRTTMPGMRIVIAVTLLTALCGAGASAPARAADIVSAAGRPRIGLVLGGGGARGAAHIGVLEVLERLRVPVDCVAGTSMGALVAGAWAAGLSPAQMREQLAAADWADMFLDNPGYVELSLRSKSLARRFLPGSETGIQNGGAVTPPGVVSGQKIKLFLNHLVRADTGEPVIERLPLPLSIIATDIGNGERVVYRDGSLTQALRASMSVPGLMAPLEYRSRKLVDGGLVDNVPIREVRERCDAQVVIAVNVGSPPLRPEQVSGLLSVSAQVLALLTEQNVSASLATLTARDILIKPDLGDITAADFDRHRDAADRGRVAAEGVAARLAGLSQTPAAYAAWRQRMAVGENLPPRVDEIQIAGMLRADPELIRRHLQQRVGQPLDSAGLSRDLLRAYGDGHYESVDYTLLSERGRHILRVLPVEKSWGPDYLRLGVQLDSNLSQGSTYLLRAGLHKTWLNALGGELLVTAELGSSTGAGVALHQPLTHAHDWFVDAVADYRRERVDYFFEEQRVAEYRSARSRLELVAGIDFKLLGQLRAGWRETRVTQQLETGIDVFSLLPRQSSGGWLLGLDMDRLDRLHFPTRGWAAQAEWYESDRRDYARASILLRGALPWRQYVLAGRASWVGSPRGALPLHDAGKLGGFLNLTGFASGQLLGDRVAYAHVRAERIIGSLPLGLRGDMRLGLAVEAGRVGQPYARQRRDGWLNSVALYIGGETPIGPVYLGLGQGSGKSTNAYLFVGTP